MTVLEAIIWGVIQGTTEFIPISSSGHLVVIPRLFGIEAPDLIFNIALHVGTLAAVIIFFRKDLIALFTSQKMLGALVLFATLPIFICGLLFADGIRGFFESPEAVGWMFVLNGGIILIGHLKLRKSNHPPSKGYSMLRALVIGVAQSLALFPGISRSGITITTGVYTGMKREDAYRFSFLLFIPATLLAFLYSLKEVSSVSGAFNINMLTGAAFSAIFGLLALKLLFELLKRARLYFLGFYCIGLGLLTVCIF